MKTIGIIGTGPAALMAADLLSRDCSVSVFEKNSGPARKLLIAGSSGLNVTNSASHSDFVKAYSGAPRPDFWEEILTAFSPQDWLKFLNDLGEETFLGTSGRYFIKNMKASKLLQAWIQRLEARGVEFYFQHEFTGFDVKNGKIQADFTGHAPREFDALCLCLGGGSYEDRFKWPEILRKKNLQITPLMPANVGYEVAWKPEFLAEAEGKPLKNISFETSRGSMRGEVVVTRYGLEGTPVYALGTSGAAYIDLFPDHNAQSLKTKLDKVKENMSLLRKAKRALSFAPVAHALLYHHYPYFEIEDLKRLPVELLKARPLEEAISMSGGLSWQELDDALMLRKYPGVFACGEMLDWNAPTGGFLIQGCVSTAVRAATGIKTRLSGF